MPEPSIPRDITVHLGPPNSNAPNVTVPFPDYIKNVASSEIYPTWPENAIRANVYAQISFALNRIYNEWYRSQGYDFDITNSTQYDQSYKPGREIFENVSQIVDEIFNSYVRRQGNVDPFFTEYCNGTTVTCPGLSQWGTVALAEAGYTPYEILQNYYGDNIDIITNVPVKTNTPSYPGLPLRLGSASNDVKTIQVQLNRISRNYPGIPKIDNPDSVFGPETEEAVKAFQRIFKLTPDGVVGESTWYKIAYIYTAVKKLSELSSEGITYEEAARQYPTLLQLGSENVGVGTLQYYLNVIADFYETIPSVPITGIFDEQTQKAVIAFQNLFGLTPDGIVGRDTWNQIYRTFRGIIQSAQPFEGGVVYFDGNTLRQGSTGERVTILQQYLSLISDYYPEVNKVNITGTFDAGTTAAVRQLQSRFGIPPSGIVGAITWDVIAELYSDLVTGTDKRPGQYPGYTMEEA